MKTKNNFKRNIILLMLCSSFLNVSSQFVPGSGEDLPYYTKKYTVDDYQIKALYVDVSQRLFSVDKKSLLHLVLKFPPANSFGDKCVYELESLKNGKWETFNYRYQVPNIRYSDLYIICDTVLNTKFRLKTINCDNAGYTTNEINVTTTMTQTNVYIYVTGFGATCNYIGCEYHIAEVVVKNIFNDEIVDNVIRLQWYRLVPENWEFILIPNANTERYITTEDDIGYYHACKITTIVGGERTIIVSMTKPLLLNNAYITDVAHDGFTLNLLRDPISIEPIDFNLINGIYPNKTIEIESIKKLSKGIYRVNVELKKEDLRYFLNMNYNPSPYWTIYNGLYTQLQIELPYNLGNIDESYNFKIYQKPNLNTITIESPTIINSLFIIGLDGRLLISKEIKDMSCNLDMENLNSGLYFIKLNYSHNTITKKIIFIKR